MDAKYYWNFSLDDIKKKTKNKELLDYFIMNKAEAKSIIKSIRDRPITYSVGKLNEIDEKLSLLFFYLFDGSIFIQQENKIIDIIEKEYQQSFFEELAEVCSGKEKFSFIYMLDNNCENKPIWERNFIEILSNDSNLEGATELNKWKVIADFYQYLQLSARSILKDLNAQNFNYQFPKLLLIDTKCRIITNTVAYTRFSKMTEIEFILTIENQAEQYLRESFVREDADTSCYSFRRQAFNIS